MGQRRMPKPGELYKHFKDRLYQIITVAVNTETHELMVVYQALYGDFKTYVRPLDMFLSEVDHVKYPDVKQTYRFELWRTQDGDAAGQEKAEAAGKSEPERQKADTAADIISDIKRKPATTLRTSGQIEAADAASSINIQSRKASVIRETKEESAGNSVPEEAVSDLLIRFLDAKTYNKKLEILTSNTKNMNDRLINDMAVALDCTVDEGPLDQRIQGLIHCLQAMRRFEDRRLR